MFKFKPILGVQSGKKNIVEGLCGSKPPSFKQVMLRKLQMITAVDGQVMWQTSGRLVQTKMDPVYQLLSWVYSYNMVLFFGCLFSTPFEAP